MKVEAFFLDEKRRFHFISHMVQMKATVDDGDWLLPDGLYIPHGSDESIRYLVLL